MSMFIVAGAPLQGGPATHCEGGEQRTIEGLARYGLKLGDTVTMRDCLEVLGVSDTVFSLPYVVKQYAGEAKQVMLQYMAFEIDVAIGLMPLLEISSYAKYLNAVKKRAQGHSRPGPLAEAHEFYNRLHKEAIHPVHKYTTAAMVALSCDKPDNIAACHAGIALMDAGRADGRREQVAETLINKMRELIPVSSHDHWDKMKP